MGEEGGEAWESQRLREDDPRGERSSGNEQKLLVFSWSLNMEEEEEEKLNFKRVRTEDVFLWKIRHHTR